MATLTAIAASVARPGSGLDGRDKPGHDEIEGDEMEGLDLNPFRQDERSPYFPSAGAGS